MLNKNKQKTQIQAPPTHCNFCVLGVKALDYKDTRVYQKYISSYFKILPRRRTGLCMRHQRLTAEAVKRARFMALEPYTPK
ncbi:30S ribosomal protein S18 [Candidatus Parcubacteria bacterium]|jgi:small subunit ribosomal protein S18|nr:MAG: 30S ribosomal protein S18 [Candidatus Parcubacteria bacterium]